MSPLEIKIDLMRAGISMADIARQCGVARQSVSLVVSGKFRSPDIEQTVAAALGREVAEVFSPDLSVERRGRSRKASIQHKA